MTRQFHRPARLDPEAAESIEGAIDTAASSELAHQAAQALFGDSPLAHDGPGAGDPGEWITRPGVVAVVAAHGVDAVAELWADSPATTLPGVLWRLFLVREWIRRDPALVARRYATVVDLTGRDDKVLARFEAALAEADPAPSPLDVRALLDRVLTGRADGGLPALVPVLATVAAFLRALAAGSDPAWIVDDADELADRVTRRDSALLATADEVTEAARRAASGRLD